MTNPPHNVAQVASFKSQSLRYFSVALLGILCVVAAALTPSVTLKGETYAFWGILPPVFALILIISTKWLIRSLLLAVILGALLHAWQGLGEGFGISLFFTVLWQVLSDPWNLQILAFVPFMMAMIMVMVAGGGFKSIVVLLSGLCKGRRSTQLATILSGLVLFFDDYANSMIVGSTMRPITDAKRVSRAKLAFLVDATAAPIAGLAVVSTWIGYEVGLFQDVSQTLGLGKDGFEIFLAALPFRFYCMFMLVFVVVNAVTGRDFGPMLAAEQQAQRLSAQQNVAEQRSASLIAHLGLVVFPLGSLALIIVLGIWMDGGKVWELAREPWLLLSWSIWKTVLIAGENTMGIFALAGGVGLAMALLWSKGFLNTDGKELGRATVEGVRISLSPIMILILAWTLKAMCDKLGTGYYIAGVLQGTVPPLLFPASLFVVAGAVALMTGTSWGTMAILIPTALPLAYALDGEVFGLITTMSFAAVLDGAIFGDHCSPISDTTIMSATASHCEQLEHVVTQFPYALTVAGIALSSGYLLGVAVEGYWPYLAGVIAVVSVLFIFGRGLHKPDQGAV